MKILTHLTLALTLQTVVAIIAQAETPTKNARGAGIHPAAPPAIVELTLESAGARMPGLMYLANGPAFIVKL